MVGAESGTLDRESAFEHGSCLVPVAPAHGEHGQVVEHGTDFLVVGAMALLVNRERPTVVVAGSIEVPESFGCEAEAGQDRRHLGVLGPDRPLPQA